MSERSLGECDERLSPWRITLYAASGAPAGPELTAQLLVHSTVALRVLILPVTALWLAELSADRMAIRLRGAEALKRALTWQTREAPAGMVRRASGLLTHPPTGLRRAVAAGRFGLTGLALAWPAALIARLMLSSFVGLPAFMLIGDSLGEAATRVLQSIAWALADDWLILTGTAALLIAWPLLMRRRSADGPKPYLIASLVPLALLTVGLLFGTST